MKIFKKTALLLAAVLMILTLCSCTKKENKNITYSTYLNIVSSFSGTRDIKITYPKSFAEPSSEKAEELEKIIRKNCPSSLTYLAGESEDGEIEYTFTLSFSSISDYISKLTDLLGNRPVVTFSNPNTALTKGWRIEEDFQSMQLFDWIKKSAENDDIVFSEFKSAEAETKVSFGNNTASSAPVVSVNQLSGYPIEKIKLNTVNKTTATEQLFDRTITFTVTQETFDKLGDKLTQYFSSITDNSADAEWQLENDNYIYTVIFDSVSIKQLEGYTNRLFSSVYGDISYVDKTVGSTALAYQNSYTETIDFTNYVGHDNSDVPVEYTYSITNNSELDHCRIYSGLKWENAEELLETNNPGKLAAIKSSSPSLTLRINDGKQYIPKSIDITVTPLDNDNIRKSVAFVYDIAESGYEACNYTASFFSPLGLIPSQTVDEGNSICTISVSGTPEEINAKLTDVFGDDNIITASSEVPFMTLRTKKHITDRVDLSSLLTGKNEDTPVNYYLKPAGGELAEKLSLEKNESSEITTAENNTDEIYSLQLAGSKGTFRSTVSAPDIFDIVIFCIVSLIMILCTVGFILLLKNHMPKAPEIESGDIPSALPEKNKAKNTMIPKKEIKNSQNKH